MMSSLQTREKIQVDFTHEELYAFYSKVHAYTCVLNEWKSPHPVCVFVVGGHPGATGQLGMNCWRSAITSVFCFF